MNQSLNETNTNLLELVLSPSQREGGREGGREGWGEGGRKGEWARDREGEREGGNTHYHAYMIMQYKVRPFSPHGFLYAVVGTLTSSMSSSCLKRELGRYLPTVSLNCSMSPVVTL